MSNHGTSCSKDSSGQGSSISDLFRKTVYPIPHVSMKLEETQAEEGARQLLQQIRPDWPTDDIRCKMFTEGYTNKLMCCSAKSKDDEPVLIRIYGNQTDLMINRETERNCLVLLNLIGCAAPIFCRFDNGIAYGYLPGVVLDVDMARRPHMQRLIARELVQMQSLDSDSLSERYGSALRLDTQPSIFRTLYNWLELVPLSYNDPHKQAQFDQLSTSRDQLRAEVDLLHGILPGLGSPVVFCHNDLILKNIIYNEQQQNITFIDFEYAAYNYQAFDIAMHFCEYAGMEDLDFSLYPDHEYQSGWLRTFLELNFQRSGRKPSEVTSVDVKRLYAQVNKFALAVHLYCSLWGLIQACYSSIDYDYINFARARLTEYLARKSEFLALKLP